MTFGPYKLLNVRVDSGSLVLDLGDQNDQAVYHPRRFLSFGDSERIQEEATKLIGSMVVTETANEAKNSPKIWWKSVRKYSELTLKPPPVQARFIRPIPKLVLPSPTIDAEQSVAQLTAKAQAGDSDSQFKLGEIYDAGKGVPRSLGKAMDWYQRAAAQGHSLARKVLGIEDTSSADMAHAPVTEDKHVTKIYGPPGTGKTSALLKEVKDAIAQGISPDMIGFFSFTNKATDEAKARMVELFPQFNIESDFPYFRTIHSLANQSLRTRVKVISDKEAIEFDRGVIVERPFMREGDESSQVVRVKHPVLDAATTARSLKVSFEKYLQTMPRTQRWPLNKWLGVPRSLWTKELSELGIRKLLQYEVRYEEYKRTLGVIDFADMLDRALIDRMALPELKLLLVDEAQDLSPVQWDLVRALIAQSESCFIAGDDDQAICESFGASATEFIDLPGNKEFETILDASRRVPPAIHTALKPLIARLDAKFPRRTRKTWKPKDDGVEGTVGYFSSMDDFLKTIIDVESKKVDKSTLLMFATNASLGKFSGVLSEHGVTHFASNRLIGSGATNIRMQTIWGAKGGEAEITALIADSDMDFNMLSEDPRLEYVAHTRAKESFYYVGRFAAPVPEQPKVPTENANTQKTVSAEATLSPTSVSQLLEKFGQTNR